MEIFSKSKDIFFSNFSKICRTCIKIEDEPLHQIFESDVLILNENIKTSEVLLAVSTLKMEPEDDLPKGLCIQCLDSLTKAYNFQKMCILSDLCMRSAILPSEMQIISKIVTPVESDNIKELETVFLDVMPPSENETSVNVLFTDQMPAINENISNLYQASRMESCIQSALIPNDENSGIQILLVESLPSVGDLGHHLNETGAESAIIVSRENESNFNIFPAEKAIISEPLIISNVFPTEPHISYTNEPNETSDNDASEKASVTERYQQNAIISNKNKRNVKILSIKELPTVSDPVNHFIETISSKPSKNNSKNVKKTNNDAFEKASDTKLCQQNEKLSIKNKHNVKILSIEELPTVSDPVNHFKETIGSKLSTQISKNLNKTKVKINRLLDGDIGKSEKKRVLKTELTCENDESKNLIDADQSIGEILNVKKKEYKGKKLKDLQEIIKTTLDHENIEDEEKTSVINESSPKESQQVGSLSIVPKVENNLRLHSVKLPFLCSDCGKAFSDASNLRQHALSHTGVRGFQCPECPSKFTYRSYLLIHKNTHRKQKPFVCDVCNSGFTTKYYMRKHKLTHTSEKPHKCDDCEKRFSTLDHMKCHKRTHTGDKPYACKNCEKKFVQSNDMIAHLRKHLGEKVYQCEECDASFKLNMELKKHLADHYKSKRRNAQKKNSKTKNSSTTKNSSAKLLWAHWRQDIRLKKMKKNKELFFKIRAKINQRKIRTKVVKNSK